MTKPPPSIISLTRIQFGIHGAGIVLAFFISIGLTHLYGSPCAPFGCNRLLTYTYMPVHHWWTQLYGYGYDRALADFYMSTLFYGLNIMILIWIGIEVFDFRRIFLPGILAQSYRACYKAIFGFLLLFLVTFSLFYFYDLKMSAYKLAPSMEMPMIYNVMYFLGWGFIESSLFFSMLSFILALFIKCRHSS